MNQFKRNRNRRRTSMVHIQSNWLASGRIEDVDQDSVIIAVVGDSACELIFTRELKRARVVRVEDTPNRLR